jgi:hypothetical protein
VDWLTRIFDVYRQTALTRSAIALIVANAIPLIGVLFFGWSLWTILVIYWLENGIVGFWNVPKIALARGSMVSLPPGRNVPPAMSALGGTIPGPGRVGMALFFLVHYGLFWLGHGFFVFVLPNFAGAWQGPVPCAQPGELLPGFPECVSSPFGQVIWSNVWIAAVALFLSHGASFVFNYLGRGEYLRTSAPQQMFKPYGRVVVLHLTIIFGAFIAAFLSAPIGILLILVVLKTLFDLGLHLNEHRENWLTGGGVSSG